MEWQLFTILLFTSSLLCLGITIYSFGKKTFLSSLFGLLMSAMTIWTAGYAIEILSSSEDFIHLLLLAEYLGIVTVPPLWLLFTLEFVAHGNRPGRFLTTAFFAIPLATLVLLATNDGHQLFYSSMQVVSACGAVVLDVTPGFWFWVNWVYSVSCLLSGLVLLLSRFRRTTGPYRRQVFALFAGLAVPAAANIAYVLGARPCGYFDITPVAFSISGIAGAWGIKRHRLLDLSPVNCMAILENLECALFVFDKNGALAEINPAAKRLLSTDVEPVGEPVKKIFKGWPLLEELVTTENARDPVEISLPSVRHPDVSRWWSADSTVLHDRKGKKTGKVIVLYDITNLKHAEQARNESEILYRTLVENAAEIVFSLDGKGRLTYVSPAVKNVAGYEPSFLAGKDLTPFLHPEDREACDEAVKTAFGGGRGKSGLEFRFRMLDGTWRWFNATFASLPAGTGEVHQVLGIAEDIQKRKEYEQHLLYTSAHDALTGLYNRDYFDSQMEMFMKEKTSPVAVIMIDCNGLKGINDTEGHAAGDMHLKKTADFLVSAFPEEAVVARIGGDEFAVLLPGKNEREAEAILRSAQDTIKEMNAGAPEHDVDVSMGLAVYDAEGSLTLRQVLQEADRKMYRNKREQ
ncbi:MAG: histidine kinase N-terminal 7TM domain-containing protein [Thermovirgaceae bacterium]